jgi:hypothetical protein
MKNSTNYKEREIFFMKYFGTKTLYVGGIGLQVVGDRGWNLKHHDFYLELKHLSKITDTDALEYFNILWSEHHHNKSDAFKIEYGKDWANNICSQNFGLIPANVLHGYDFLRSKGYALPFMQYSVDDLVRMGWIKLWQ